MASDFKRHAMESASFAVLSTKIKQEPVDSTSRDEEPLLPEVRGIKSEPTDSIDQLLVKSLHIKREPIDDASSENNTSEKAVIESERPQKLLNTEVSSLGIQKNKIKTDSPKPFGEVNNFKIKKDLKNETDASSQNANNATSAQQILQTVSMEVSVDRAANDCPICLNTVPNVQKLREQRSDTCAPKESLVEKEPVDSNQSFQSKHTDKSIFHAKKQSINEARTEKDSCPVCSKVPCPVCSKLYFSNKLQRHLRMTHPPESCSVSCHLCERQFKAQQFLAYHLKVSHQPSNASYYCDLCSKCYTSLHTYKVHIKTVHPPKTLQVQCKLCSKYFKSKQHLRLHTISVHPAKNEHTNCTKCSKVFKSRIHLAQHMKKVHRQYCCCVCRVEFENRRELEDHAAAKHFRDCSLVICDNCAHTYASKVKLIQHLRLNQCRGVKCKCHVCGRELRSKICLQRHIIAVHRLSPVTHGSGSGERKLTCRLCEFGCTSKLELKRHMTEMHRDLKSAEDLNDVPLTAHEMINLPLHEFNKRRKTHNLSEEQLAHARRIRRKGRNKLSAQKCSRRKLEEIMSLSDEVQMVRDRRKCLRSEQQSLITESERTMDSLAALYRYVSENLRDENGSPLSSEQFLLQYAADGSVVLMPHKTLDLKQSGEGLVKLEADLPLNSHEMINLPLHEFTKRRKTHNFSEEQLAHARRIRRKGRNKLYAQKCHRRKLEEIMSLSDEVQMVRDRMKCLRSEQQSLITERERTMDSLAALYRYVSENLRDENGSPLSSEQFLLQHADDGSVVLMPHKTLDLKQSGEGLVKLEGEGHMKLAIHEELVCKKEKYEQ